MVTKITEFYKMEFYDSYVILEGIGEFVVDSARAKETLQLIIDHFKGRDFVIISNRTSNYTLTPDAYSSSLFKKVKGIAVVSKNEETRENALFEQVKFNSSFAFFENLEDAKRWAESFILN